MHACVRACVRFRVGACLLEASGSVKVEPLQAESGRLVVPDVPLHVHSVSAAPEPAEAGRVIVTKLSGLEQLDTWWRRGRWACKRFQAKRASKAKVLDPP